MAPYIELHCHSNFSLLDGASHPEELAAAAADLNMPALALTDHDAVYGAPRYFQAAADYGIKPIIGAELTLTNQHHLTLLAENETGWHNLCYLISRGRHGKTKGESELPIDELVGCTTGLIALSGCRYSEIGTALLRDDRDKAMVAARRFSDLFGANNFFIELQRHHLPGEERLIPKADALARYLKLGRVVTNNVHYARRDGHRLQDVLVCIRHHTHLDEIAQVRNGFDPLSTKRRLNSEFYLKTANEMTHLFPDQKEALANSVRIADRCSFELQYGLQDLPHFETPHGMNSSAYLRRLCEEGVHSRFGGDLLSTLGVSGRDRLGLELDIIENAGLANYFLIVWDIVRFSRSQGIRCQGRGSAANSLVAYLLHISPIDPLSHDLVFERFLSAERQVVPDIDIDFDAQRREEVIQYIYSKYGAEHTAMSCTFVTFQSRSAVRDISKALNLPPETVAAAARVMEGEPMPDSNESGDILPINMLLELCKQIDGFPRHLGIHSGGMIVTGAPLMGRVPTEPASMKDRVVVQWDKDGLEDTGLVKIDILALRFLSAITETADSIKNITGFPPDLDNLSFDDSAVYDMLCQADTIGVFQVESRAQAQTLPRLRPRNFNDLVISISLIRPGPIQGDMVHPFLRRRLGEEPVEYDHPLLESALSETLGVILFQEQVLKVARDIAGFSPGQGELLRRALGSKRATAAIAKFQDDFIYGAKSKGVPLETAEKLFEKLLAFGSYSFPKSHAAAFSVIVYQSAWLKHYHFVPFISSLLNNQPMGFWTPAVLVNEAKRNGVEVQPVDIHISQEGCTPNDSGSTGSIRLGFNYVKSLDHNLVKNIIRERETAPFKNLADFFHRTRPGRRAAENLIMTGAMDSWEIPRRQLIWELGTLQHREGEFELSIDQEEVQLPQLTPAEALLVEHDVQGLSTGNHVMNFYKDWLAERGILGNEDLARCRDGQRVQVAGLVVIHQAPPTAKGHRFITLEDQDGMMNIIIRPKVYVKYRRVLHEHSLLLIEGRVQMRGGTINIVATGAAGLTELK